MDQCLAQASLLTSLLTDIKTQYNLYQFLWGKTILYICINGLMTSVQKHLVQCGNQNVNKCAFLHGKGYRKEFD